MLRFIPLRRLSVVVSLLTIVLFFLVGWAQSTSPSWQRATTSAAAPHLGARIAYTPGQIHTAYDFSPLYASGIDGKGQKVALIELGRIDPKDLSRFDATYGLPAATIKQYYPAGYHPPSKADPETTLDVEWLHALAPRASIQIYYLDPNSRVRSGWQTMAKALRAAVQRGVRTVSISIGTCSATPGSEVVTSTLSNLVAQGVTVFVASGDDGDRPGPAKMCGGDVGVGYPSSDPSVVAVGGTSLHLTRNSVIANEIAWASSGGGNEPSFPRPAWQIAPSLPADGTRWVPDVAFLADPQTGVREFYKGKWMIAGGTSLGAPAWAAAWTLILQQAQRSGTSIGAGAPLLYRLGNSAAYGQSFHDITVGSNGQYDAGPGWDPVTGWGTPDVAKLAVSVKSLAAAR